MIDLLVQDYKFPHEKTLLVCFGHNWHGAVSYPRFVLDLDRETGALGWTYVTKEGGLHVAFSVEDKDERA